MLIHEFTSVIRNMLSGKIDLLVGCRKLIQLRPYIDIEEDEDWLIIVGIESETDDVPLGNERLTWNLDRLRIKDAEIQTYMKKTKPLLLDACRKVLAKLETTEGRRRGRRRGRP